MLKRVIAKQMPLHVAPNKVCGCSDKKCNM